VCRYEDGGRGGCGWGAGSVLFCVWVGGCGGGGGSGCFCVFGPMLCCRGVSLCVYVAFLGLGGGCLFAVQYVIVVLVLVAVRVLGGVWFFFWFCFFF